MDLPPTVCQIIKNLWSNLNKPLAKHNDSASTKNKVIAKKISAFLKSSKQNMNQKSPLSAAVYL